MFGFFSRLLTAEKRSKLDEEPAFPLGELPSLVIERVLDCLNYTDLFSLRRTCKWLKSIVDRRKPQKLILFINAYPSPKRLFYTNEPVGYPHSLRITDLTVLGSPGFRHHFADIHTLAIFYDPPTIDNLVSHLTIDLNALDCYRKLRFLQIDLVGFLHGSLKNLDQLRVCFLKARLGSSFRLANQLEALAVLEFACPELESAEHFNRLTYLYLDSALTLTLQKFANLQVICFGMLSSMEKVLDQINSGHLSLPALSEIRILDWASSYFGRTRLVERLQTFEQNERTKYVKIFLGDCRISAEQLTATLELIKSFDSKAKYFGAILCTEYLVFLYRNAGELSHLYPFVHKLIIDQDLKFHGLNSHIKDLRLENLEMLALRSRFLNDRGKFEGCTSKQDTSYEQDDPLKQDDFPSSASSYASCYSSPTDEHPIDGKPSTDYELSYRASELFFKFWIKRWPKIRHLELQDHFNQADFDSLVCLLNLKNLTFFNCRPDNFDFVPRLRNLEILQFRSEPLQRPILTENEFVFLFKRVPSLRELHARTKVQLLEVLKHHRKHFEISKHELTKAKPIKISEFHSARSAGNYALRKLNRSTD